jgi:hypothetical protein
MPNVLSLQSSESIANRSVT